MLNLKGSNRIEKKMVILRFFAIFQILWYIGMGCSAQKCEKMPKSVHPSGLSTLFIQPHTSLNVTTHLLFLASPL
jgi:hypothetical protein